MPDTPINRLRSTADFLRSGQLPPPDLTAWLIEGVQRYEARALAGDPIGLDAALGLGRPGAHGWWTAEAKEHRNALLVQLRRGRFRDLSDGAASRAICNALRYPGGDPVVRAILDTGCGVLSAKQMRRIITGHFQVEEFSIG